jgi:hypothetical protein
MIPRRAHRQEQREHVATPEVDRARMPERAQRAVVVADRRLHGRDVVEVERLGRRSSPACASARAAR